MTAATRRGSAGATLATRPADRLPDSLAWATPVLGLLALVSWFAGLHRVDPGTLDGFGLVKAMSPLTWLGCLLLVSCAVIELGGRARGWLMALVCAAAVLFVYGLQTLTYSAARLPIGWLHVGFAEQFTRYGDIIHDFDTRFSWPGFFTSASMWASAAGFPTAEPMVKWAPVALLGASALAMHALATSVLRHRRAAWLATLIFIAANWTEQEYFSPQGLAFVLVMSCLAIVSHALVFSWVDRVRGLRWWNRPQPANAPGDRIVAQLFAALIIVALAPTHQLSPFMLMGFLVVIAMSGRLSSGWLPVIALLAPCVWFVLGAQEFWVGQLAMLTEGAGSLSTSLDQGVAGRVRGDVGHQLMVLGRIGITGVLGLSAVLAALYMLRRRRTPWLLGVMAAAAFAMAVIQPYGGEIFMRCYLFALPWFAMAAAWALADLWGRVTRPRVIQLVCALFLAGVMAANITVKGGNDAYVAFASADVVATRVAVESAPEGGIVAAAIWYSPLRLERVKDINQLSPEELQGPDSNCRGVDAMYDCILQIQTSRVILTPAQENAGEILHGFEPGWMDSFRERLVREAGYRIIYAEDGRYVLAAPAS